MPVDLAVPVTERAALPASGSRWLSVVSHLDPKYGGLSAVVPQLASTLSAAPHFDVRLAAFCLPEECYRPVSYSDLQVSYWPTSRKAWLIDRTLGKRFKQSVAAAQALHIHGLWEQSTFVAARTARSLGKPYILSAHGMLEPWALAQRRTKKRVYAALFERANLEGAACLHALTRAEVRNYRNFGSKQPIAIIPNGVTIPEQVSPDLFLETYPAMRAKRMLLFLGRLHRKKGVELLIRAWKKSRAGVSDACLVLAGPSEDDTRVQMESLVAELGISEQVLFPGMLGSAMKWSALAAAAGFVLPSWSEGLSVATLEAMGMGLPVIVTENCNLPEVAEQQAGWQIRLDADELTAAIQSWAKNSDAANSCLGQRGAAFVGERYSWSTVAAQMAELYSWVEGGPRPQSFELETDGGRL